MTKNQQELIDKYISGQLSGIEQEVFNQAMSDLAFRKEVELNETLATVLREDSQYNIFKRVLTQAETKYFDKSIDKNKWYFPLAATFLILITASVIYYMVLPSSTDQLFENYYQPFEGPTNFRSDDVRLLDELFIQGLLQYDQGNYEQAIAHFEKTIADDSLNFTARFLLGTSLLAVDDSDQSEQVFDDLLNKEGHVFRDDILWHLALIDLKNQKREEALLKLQDIENKNQRTLELIRKLD